MKFAYLLAVAAAVKVDPEMLSEMKKLKDADVDLTLDDIPDSQVHAAIWEKPVEEEEQDYVQLKQALQLQDDGEDVLIQLNTNNRLMAAVAQRVGLKWDDVALTGTEIDLDDEEENAVQPDEYLSSDIKNIA